MELKTRAHTVQHAHGPRTSCPTKLLAIFELDASVLTAKTLSNMVIVLHVAAGFLSFTDEGGQTAHPLASTSYCGISIVNKKGSTEEHWQTRQRLGILENLDREN